MKYLVFVLCTVFLACGEKRTAMPAYMSVSNGYTTLNGFALGTYFKITYSDLQKRDYYDSIKYLLYRFENSLSVYRENSLISKINNNMDTVPDKYFLAVFDKAKQISEQTDGAFDISASPLFEIWGWGAKKRENRITPSMIDSLKQYVGMDKIWIENGKIVKTSPHITLNTNAIAKGYASDITAEFLETKGIDNYMINIGGEIVVKGKNKQGKDWLIGIDKPDDGNMISGLELQATLQLTNKSLATSGDYRRFFIDSVDGKKYSHAIDPRSGYSARQNVLSATVIAPDCMSADAYATAFMVMGLEKTKKFLENHPELEVFLICSDREKIVEYRSDNIKSRFVE
ncbi:MAG: FAD:protein FMN transferase [Prevotellaceae bacterium]|jgi:thiamine biosynthesis lipoprotein|nr:FAD:protein FMN transferase [Prevotellaceae bacterium]